MAKSYIDTSCLMVLRPAFRHLIAWVLQGQDTAAETDQFLWRQLRDSGVRMAFVDRPTVAYRTRHTGCITNMAGEAPPPGAICGHGRAGASDARYTGVPAQSPSTVRRPVAHDSRVSGQSVHIHRVGDDQRPSAPAPLAAVRGHEPPRYSAATSPISMRR